MSKFGSLLITLNLLLPQPLNSFYLYYFYECYIWQKSLFTIFYVQRKLLKDKVRWIFRNVNLGIVLFEQKHLSKSRLQYTWIKIQKHDLNIAWKANFIPSNIFVPVIYYGACLQIALQIIRANSYSSNFIFNLYLHEIVRKPIVFLLFQKGIEVNFPINRLLLVNSDSGRNKGIDI